MHFPAHPTAGFESLAGDTPSCGDWDHRRDRCRGRRGIGGVRAISYALKGNLFGGNGREVAGVLDFGFRPPDWIAKFGQAISFLGHQPGRSRCTGGLEGPAEINMSLPDFILRNFRWKAGALILAVFVWFLIQLAISEGFRPSESLLADFQEETFLEQPVHVLTAPTDTHRFKVTPDRVLVTIRANASVLKRLTVADIRAFVDLADWVDSTNLVTGARRMSTRLKALPFVDQVAWAVTVERIELPLVQPRSDYEFNERIFGTDGVRGTANIEPVTLKPPEAAALRLMFQEPSASSQLRGKHKIVIGRTHACRVMLETRFRPAFFNGRGCPLHRTAADARCGLRRAASAPTPAS